ncbi:hsp90-like protein [Coniochaeta sp. 2T2.1]|nr:hsp90-like protein [Coniochaeta sp. 2T2.1]
METGILGSLKKESRLDVLFNNAGVMVGPEEPIPETAQGHERSIGVKCMATTLFTKLLTPLLVVTAKVAPPNSARVISFSSFALELNGAKDVGVDLTNLDFRISVSNTDRSSSSDSSPTISEAVRERETFKYDALKISTAALLDPEDAKPIPSAVLSSTPDPGLTAFAQLGLYRLDGSRALVSLFDRKNQHIVAEALRATPLNLSEDGLDLPWLCGTAVPRATSICEHVIAGPPGLHTIPGKNTGNAPEDLPVSVVLDLDEDERFCAVQDPHKRFYIGVPIRSPAGINIGVYCIFDDKPRRHVTEVEIQFIRDMSRTIMDYLEAKRSHECYRREERMVRGLGSFVEGKATLSNWSQSSNPSSFQDIPGAQEGSLNKRLRGKQRPPNPFTRDSRAQSKVRPPPPERAVTPLDTRLAATKNKPLSGHKPRLSSADILQGDVEGVFSKASNIIRESLEVAGVLYLDASIRSFGGLIGQEMSSPAVLRKLSSDESASSSDEIPSSHSGENADGTCCKVLGYSTSENSSVNGDQAVDPLTTLPEKLLHYLLQRYPHGRIYNMEADVVPLSDFSAADLTLSFKRKGGPSITINQRGATNGQTGGPKSRQTITALLARLFPGARSVAFVPLWDSQRNRWFAGSFVWTRTPTRIFTPENELSYLKVYGLTIMAEVTRLHIKAADKSKMDVLGSISHELRSPLHGVVGAVELLRQTSLDGSQEKILRTIQISSRTLLDTIDHVCLQHWLFILSALSANLSVYQLLDYGKMNGLIKSAKLERSNSAAHLARSLQGRGDPAAPVPDAPGLPVQLDRLAEEVVESVLAGYGYLHITDTTDMILDSGDSSHRSSWKPGKGDVSPMDDQRQHGSDPQAVQIYLDIEPAMSWSFLMHPGAFRRIIMNLFGNSLKFTKAGFIRVHLRQESLGPDKVVPGVGRILLTVTDTGKGISEDYLRNQLFTPFAQENQFAPGTGLGLSLVRQVVVGLGGEIQVESQLGHGTAVTVSLPLPVGQGTDEEETGFGKTVQELAGLTVALHGSGQIGTTQESGAGNKAENHHRDDRSQQLQLIENICRGWLKMQVLSDVDAQDSAPDFIVSTSEPLPGGIADNNTWDHASCPHIFVYGSPSVMQSTVSQLRMPAFFEFISQPLGPRKLAKSLSDSRRRWKEAQQAAQKLAASTTDVPTQKPLLTSTPSQTAELTAVLRVAGIIDESTKLTPSTEQPATAQRKESVDNAVMSRPATPVPSQIHRPATTRKIVLIVDDNPINRKILAAYMKRIDQPHHMATNGLEALEMYQGSPSEYSCILTDISMPVMDGLECSRRAREFERARQLRPCKIIALTGLSGTLVQQDAFASGVDVFLTRPVTLKSVVDTLEELGVR